MVASQCFTFLRKCRRSNSYIPGLVDIHFSFFYSPGQVLTTLKGILNDCYSTNRPGKAHKTTRGRSPSIRKKNCGPDSGIKQE